MARPVWFVKLIQRFFPQRFALARLTHLRLFGALVDHGLFWGDDLLYLPKDETVSTIRIEAAIETAPDMVLPSQIVEHFIEQANYHWIMNFCICRQSEGCQDYPIELGCLFLGEAALGIRPEYGRLASKAEALEHVRRCREAGLVHLVGRNKLDTIWLGVGPGEKLMTICNCCPCCCLWKMLPQLNPLIARRVDKMPGVSVTVMDLCTGCGACCEGVCFVDAIRLVDGRAQIGLECRACGRCVEVCPNQAIELTIPGSSFVQQAIERLSPLVDLS
ncbi:MAG: 4Fe-4S binding protein [Anaerolineales bacterium]|nr:4Fe-4S binding protein [Anaerolineales bacterium]